MRDLELNPVAVCSDFQSGVDSVMTLVSLLYKDCHKWDSEPPGLRTLLIQVLTSYRLA